MSNPFRRKETFECPRRAEAPFRLPGDDGKDTWETGRGLIGQARGCSYCGSMNPEDFLQAVKDGKEIGPTDKSYKVYLDDPRGKFYTMHLSPEQAKEFRALYLAGRVAIGYPGNFYAGFFLPIGKDES